MRDVPRIEGTPDPRKTSQVKKDDEVDTEKFKKIMKVDESDESQKRNTRNRAEQEDETDEEDETNESSGPAPGFSSLMDETESRDSVYEGGPGTQRADSSDDDQTGPPGQSPFTMMSSDRTNGPEVPNSPNGLIIAPSANSIQEEDPTKLKAENRRMIKDAQKKSKKNLTKAINIAKNMTTGANAIAKGTTTPVPKALIDAANKPSTRKEKTDELTNLAPHALKKTHEEEEKAQQSITPSMPAKKEIETHIASDDPSMIDLEKKKTKKAEKESDDKEHNKEKEEKSVREMIQKQDIISQTPNILPAAKTEMPAYSQLSSKVYELYEKFVGLIMIQQSTGSSKTTVTLNMPGSVFNKAEIVLEKFASSPNTFHIQIAGSPQAVDSFNANMADLVAAFQANKRSFEVNIGRPYLLKEDRHIIKKLGESTDGEKGGKEDDRNNEKRNAS